MSDETRAADIGRRLAALVRGRFPGVELPGTLHVSLADADSPEWASRLLASLDRAVEDSRHRIDGLPRGRAWCHRCETGGCPHASPPDCRSVFVGYGPTGVPRWEDFAQLTLERRHPDVDRLFDDPPALLTHLSDRGRLQGEIVRAFRTPRYELLGQLAVGFYAVAPRAGEGRGVLALSVQAVGTFPRRGPARIGLNLIGASPDGGSLESLWDRESELPWRKSMHWARKALGTLLPRARGAGAATRIEPRVVGILEGLGRRLTREHRARGRRTRHAEDRHASKLRPTSKAMDDALAATEEGLYVDAARDTLVVLGDRGRTHFFTREGRHVSSVRYGRDAIERKIRAETWRPAPTEQVEEFRVRMRSRESPRR